MSSRLEIITPLGMLDFEAGHAYQINPGNQIVPMPWQAKFIKSAINKVKLDIRNYAQNMPLFIQIDRGHKAPPPVASNGNLYWSTFEGGNRTDIALDVCVDNAGNSYVTGWNWNGEFPVTTGQLTSGGGLDAFVEKFNNTAEKKWATYFWGGNLEEAKGIAYNPVNDRIYITGDVSSTNMPIQPVNNPNDGTYYQNTIGGGNYDAFLAKFDPFDGTHIRSSYFGGNGYDEGRRIAADNLGNIYIVGYTKTAAAGNSTTCEAPTNNGFPLCNPGGGAYYQDVFKGASANGYGDIFLAKFDSNDKLIHSTYFGSYLDEQAYDIKINPATNDVFITGSLGKGILASNNNCGVPTNGAFPFCDDGSGYFQIWDWNTVNSFISRFNSNGALTWSTAFQRATAFHGLAIDNNSNLYAVGYCEYQPIINACAPNSSGLVICNTGNNAYIDNTPGNLEDLYIAKFNSQNQLAWSTLYGGDDYEISPIPQQEWGITEGYIRAAVDSRNYLYVMGVTRYPGSTVFPTYNNSAFYNQSQQDGNPGSTDIFLLAFNSNNNILWASLFGGKTIPSFGGYPSTDSEHGFGICTYQDKDLYITGYSNSKTIFPQECPPMTNPYCVPPNFDVFINSDAFISRFDISSITNINEVNEQNNSFIYPNPANDKIQIILSEATFPLEYNIFNSIGQFVKKGKLNLLTSSIETKSLSDGFYFIELKNSNQSQRIKFIIQR